MNQPISAAMIEAIRAAGFQVYMRSPQDSWCYFTDGTRIGYLQNDSYAGEHFVSTVHKPNQTTGTGYKLDGVSELMKETLEQAFVTAPRWASTRDLSSVVKYRDMAEFLKASAFNSEYKLVGETA